MSAAQALVALTLAALVVSPPPVPYRGFVGAPLDASTPIPAHVAYEPDADPLDGPPPPSRSTHPTMPREVHGLRPSDLAALARAAQKRKRRAAARRGGRR